MKSPELWEEEDIQKLITSGARESQILEFKACDALEKKEPKRREAAKDVSAFANAVGGTIVYGLIESISTHEAERIDQGYDPSDISELWLEQVIDSKIQPRIDGLMIKPVPLKASDGKVLYIVCIPASDRAPHMANHKYYKRQNFQIVEMEEYEVRQRYHREEFPGKEIAQAWRDDAINPFLNTLVSEQRLLIAERWTWNYHGKRFNGLDMIGNPSTFSANEEDFVSRYADVDALIREHDLALVNVNDLGNVLFANVAETSFIRDSFAWTTSEESMTKFISENPRFTGNTVAEVIRDIFGGDHEKQSKFDLFAEWAINGQASSATTPALFDFWRAHESRFRSLVLYPPLAEYRINVEEARRKLLEVNEHLAARLKEIRRALSERHKIAQEASHSHEIDGFYDSLGRRRGW
ncbi:MAG: hypothetical protein QOH42_1737 [Blastocatellia bacterium]|jgi:hypothetical protein|nr:hypothetical protein [Blastocatellia bacterium]